MKSWQTWTIYFGLALAIFLPLLAPGYILTFDLSWTPHFPLPSSVDNLYLFSAALHFLSLVIPSQITEKVLLFGILLLSGLGAHFLASYILKENRTWPPFFAGILYMINPFVYDRLLDGQYLVLAGYTLLPWFTLALFKFLASPSLKTTLYIVLLACLISVLSIHSVFFIFLIAVVSSTVTLWQKRGDRRYLQNAAKWAALGLLGALLASSYWLVPTILGRSTTSQQIATFDQRELYTFQTVADHTYGIPAALNPLTLYGYWGEDQGRFILPKSHMPVWGLLFLFIFALAATGAFAYWKKERGKVIIFASLIILGWILSVGIADWPFSLLNDWLLTHIPILRGYREPQKFITLIALGYAVLGALGFNCLLEKTAAWKDEAFTTMRGIFIALTLFLPLLYTPTMLFGFAGQLHASDFPSNWYAVNDKLNADKSDFKVLFLPWHHYMYFNFAGHAVSNPAPNFFDKPVIASNSDELGIIPNTAPTDTQTFVEKNILQDKTNLGSKLKDLNIKYIILAKETDWKDYSWLDQSADLKLLKDDKNLKLYKNLKF